VPATVFPDESLAPARFCEPMLAEGGPPGAALTKAVLSGAPGEWLLEPKLDGLRCIAVRNGREVSLFSRNRLPFTARFPTIAHAVASLPAANFVLDGEVVGIVDRRPNFGALQANFGALDDEEAPSIEYWVFDLPWLLGQDVRHLPINERKSLLTKAVPEGGPIRLVPTLEGEAEEVFARACAQGWEGIVAKRAGSTYREGRSSEWRKLKCICSQELVIGGFTDPRGSRDGFGALLLGYWQQDELVYAGKVGTGFTDATLRRLRRALIEIETPSSPFAGPVTERSPHWVEPTLVAEVSFSNWTRDGRLRHPSFIGLRPDKASRDVVREDCGPRPTGP
jgi:bifunctional non-homologous end joining protein LigD